MAKAANQDIIGKTYIFDYGEYAFDITVKSETVLRWELSKGHIDGPKNGENPYVASNVDDGIIFISWKEESGFQAFNVMNFNSGELITHASADEVFLNPGKVSIRE